MKLAATFALFGCATILWGADVPPAVIGAISSTAAVSIDKTLMEPSASPSWPVVEHDEIAASTAAAFLTTPEQNRLVLEPGAVINTSRLSTGELYVYLRQGELAFRVRSPRIYICAAGNLFVPRSSASGVVRVEPAGGVFDRLDRGKFEEKGKRSCNDLGVMVSLLEPGTGAVAGAGNAGIGSGAGGVTAGSGGAIAGASVGTAAASGVATAIAVGGAAAAGAAASSFVATSSSASPCPAAGCNFNPAPVSVSGPQ